MNIQYSIFNIQIKADISTGNLMLSNTFILYQKFISKATCKLSILIAESCLKFLHLQ